MTPIAHEIPDHTLASRHEFESATPRRAELNGLEPSPQAMLFSYLNSLDFTPPACLSTEDNSRHQYHLRLEVDLMNAHQRPVQYSKCRSQIGNRPDPSYVPTWVKDNGMMQECQRIGSTYGERATSEVLYHSDLDVPFYAGFARKPAE